MKRLDKAKGLGDSLSNGIHLLHLDKLAEMYTKITGEKCNCADRQEYLNKLFPYINKGA